MKPSDGPNTQEIHEIPALQSLVPCNSLVSKLILNKTTKDQGCLGIKGATSPLLSPTLFNIVAEMVMRETLEGYEGGVQIGGRRITNLRYADDIILIANTAEELQTLTRRLNEADRKVGLEINKSKTQVMTTTGATF